MLTQGASEVRANSPMEWRLSSSSFSSTALMSRLPSFQVPPFQQRCMPKLTAAMDALATAWAPCKPYLPSHLPRPRLPALPSSLPSLPSLNLAARSKQLLPCRPFRSHSAVSSAPCSSPPSAKSSSQGVVDSANTDLAYHGVPVSQAAAEGALEPSGSNGTESWEGTRRGSQEAGQASATADPAHSLCGSGASPVFPAAAVPGTAQPPCGQAHLAESQHHTSGSSAGTSGPALLTHTQAKCASSMASALPWLSPLRPPSHQLSAPPRCVPPHALAAAASLPAANSSGVAAAGPAVSTQAVAVLLGYAVLLGSCFRSVPQIVKVRSKVPEPAGFLMLLVPIQLGDMLL